MRTKLRVFGALCLLALCISSVRAADEDEKTASKTVFSLGGRVAQGRNAKVLDVDFMGSIVTDKDLPVLTAFKELQSLNLARTKITDAGLKTVAELPLLHLVTLTVH